MSKLRIGIVVNNDTRPTEGGGHVYYDMLLRGINQFSFSNEIEIINIVLHSGNTPSLTFIKRAIFIKLGWGLALKSVLKKTTTFSADTELKKKNKLYQFFGSYLFTHDNNLVRKTLIKNKIDLLYYLRPEYKVFDYPFIATNWDVAHRAIHAFPEISMDLIFKNRENYYLYTLSKAFIIFCESETGAKELKKYYPMCDEKIRILPTFAGNAINLFINLDEQARILRKYQLEKYQFFIYPAQFWPQKNHYNLLKGFKHLITELNSPQIKLVFAGSDKGNKQYITDTITDLQLDDYVVITGFVHEKEIHTFYRNAIALTMPTFLGPTNLPLLEAAHLDCAVICSQHDGHYELLADNALYVDPINELSIASAMMQMLDPAIRKQYAGLGKQHVLKSPFRLEESLKKLNTLFLNILPVRKAWGVEYKEKA